MASKIAVNQCVDKCEVIRADLRTPQLLERALETWLKEQVAPAYDAIKADPSRAISANQVRNSLAAARKASLQVG